MTSIVDFINSEDFRSSDIENYIYIGIYRDYYLNVVSILCDINIYYYLDENSFEDVKLGIIFDSSVDVKIEDVILNYVNKYKFLSSKKEIINIIYKDLKNSNFENKKIKLEGIFDSQQDEELEKELPDPRSGLPDPRSGLDLYEFEILDKLLIPISIL
jgi:hypothetical protein